MLHVHKLLSPLFGACTYAIACEQLKEAVVIDPGNPVVDGVVELLEGIQLRKVPRIILTHEHFDHIAGTEPLRARFGSKLVCSQACAAAIQDSKANMSFYKDGKGMACGPADWICERDGWEWQWAGGTIRVVATPGHSPGGMCVAIGKYLFTGDTLLGNQRTPTHFPGGDKGQLKESIARLYREFAAETEVYPGHGSPFRLGDIAARKAVGG